MLQSGEQWRASSRKDPCQLPEFQLSQKTLFPLGNERQINILHVRVRIAHTNRRVKEYTIIHGRAAVVHGERDIDPNRSAARAAIAVIRREDNVVVASIAIFIAGGAQLSRGRTNALTVSSTCYRLILEAVEIAIWCI